MSPIYIAVFFAKKTWNISTDHKLLNHRNFVLAALILFVILDEFNKTNCMKIIVRMEIIRKCWPKLCNMTQLHFFRPVIITKPIYLKNNIYFYGIKPTIIIAILLELCIGEKYGMWPNIYSFWFIQILLPCIFQIKFIIKQCNKNHI